MSAKKIDFSDLTTQEALTIVLSNAVVAKQSGHPVNVQVAKLRGEPGIMIWLPGYAIENGNMVKVQPVVAKSSGNPEVESSGK